MTFFPVSMSLSATLLTGIYLQGSVSETYLRGVFLYMGSMLPFTIGGAIAGIVFMPKFYKMRLTSIYEVWCAYWTYSLGFKPSSVSDAFFKHNQGLHQTAIALSIEES